MPDLFDEIEVEQPETKSGDIFDQFDEPTPRYNDELIAALPEPERRRLEEFGTQKPSVSIPQTTAQPREVSFTDDRPAFDWDEPLVNSEAISAATMFAQGGLPQLIPLLPKGPQELAEGVKEGIDAQIAGITTPRSVAMTPAFAIPFVGPGLAMGLGAKAIGTGAGTATGALEGGNLREAGVGLSEVAGGATMVAAPLMHRTAVAKARETGLNKAAAAAEKAIEVQAKVEPVKGEPDAIQKTEAKAPIEEGAGVQLRQETVQASEAPIKPRLVPVLETASGKLWPGMSHTEAAASARAKINADFAEGKLTREQFIKELNEVLEADDAVDIQHKMLDLNTGKTVEQGPGRVQSFNLDPKETAANLKELQDKGIKSEAPKTDTEASTRTGSKSKGNTIIAAALRDPVTGEIWSDMSHPQAWQHVKNPQNRKLDSGFITDSGEYITRDQASKISGKKQATAQKIFGQFSSPEEVAVARGAAGLSSTLAQLRELPGTATTQEAMALGKKVPKEALPQLEALAKSAADDANRIIAEVDAMPAPTQADLTRMSVAGNKSQLLNEAVEAAKGGEPAILARGINEPAKTTAKEAPTPKLAAEGVGSIPENVPTARPAQELKKGDQVVTDDYGSGVVTAVLPNRIVVRFAEGDGRPFGVAKNKVRLAETPKAAAFFERESEVAGLGRSSLPPTVADVRAQRAADAGKPPTPPKPPTQGATPSPGGPKSSLDDVYRIFETEPTKGPTLKERVVKASEAFRTGLSSSFRPLNKLVEDIAKQYSAPIKNVDVAGIFEQLKGSSGKAEADIYRFDQDVSKAVKGSEKDFNAYLFLRRSLDRLEQDLARGETRRAVSGYTIPDLQSKLATLEAKLTPEQRASFQTASENFQRHMDEALKLQVDSGRMSPEVYEAIKEGNQFYAPFKVMKYLEETARPPGTGRRVDTPASFVKAMEGIESPDFKLGDMLAAARQNISLSRVLAEKNKAMQNITDLAALDTEGLFLKKLKSGQEAPQGMDAVNVFENGVQERYAVNPDVATAVQVHGPQSGTLLARIAGNMFRAGATTFNLPFQVSNLLADIPRQALISKYGLRGVTDLIRYPLDFMEAVHASMAGNVFGQKQIAGAAIPDIIGQTITPKYGNFFPAHPNKLYLDFLDSGSAGSTVQQHLTPDALRFNPSTPQSKTKAFTKSVLNTLPEFANAVEQMSKIVGLRRAMRFEGRESGAQLARDIPEAITEIRRFSGSPDFGRIGKWTDQARLNLLYMFFNARVQGTIADVGRLTGRDGASTASKTWFKVGTAIGLPTIYAYMINNSDEYKEDYAKRPEQEKRNYWLIPKDSFITSSGGEKMRDYWRIPKRESAKWVGNFVEAGMDFAQQRDPQRFGEWAGTMLEEVFPVNIQGDTAQERLESVGASLNPIIKAPLEVATGRDMYRHRNIVPEMMRKASPEQQYTDRTAEVFRKLGEAMPDVAPEVFRSPLMLENMTKNMTAGLITQFLPRQPVEGRSNLENTPLGARFQAVPYTDSSEFEERMDRLERESTDEQLERFRNADKLIKENKGAGLKTLVQKSIAEYGPDRKQVEKVVDLWTATQRGITPQERRIMALPTQQRAAYIIGELTGKTPEQKAAIIRSYGTKRILTEAVAEQMIAQGFK